MEGAIRWFSKNHVAANALMLVVLLAGFSNWFLLRKEIFPETSADAVRLVVPYPSATPEDVESGVIIPIEEAIAEVNGIDEITSLAAENSGTVTVKVATGYDVREVMADLKTKVDAIDNLAENAETPILEEVVISAPVMSIAVSADTDEASLRLLADELRQDLLSYQAPPAEGLGGKIARALRGPPSLTKVQLAGVRDYEISIEVAEEKLRELGVSFAQVASAVRQSSLDLPGGSVKTKSGEVLVRALARRYRGAEFSNIVVRSDLAGGRILLKDVATIRDEFADEDLSLTFDGRPAVLVNVSRVGEQDTLELAEMVDAFIAEKKADLPAGVELEIWNDQSIYLEGRIDLLARNGAMGLALVVIVLALFLRPALALLVALGIPASFAGGLWLMPEMGISINMISLFGFILVLGIVVDDAIVVGENVYRRMKLGEHPREAAWKGTHEVGVVVIFGVLTTAVAFTPMLGVSGVSGKIWPNIPLVVIPVLLFSLVQSKLVLPAHLALLKPRREGQKFGPVTRLQHAVSSGLEWFVEHIYQPALRHSLRFRYIILAAFICLMALIAGLVVSGRVKSEFFPQVEADILTVKLEMVRGSAFETTEKAVQEILAASERMGARYTDQSGQPVVVHSLASAGTQPTISEFAPNGPPKASNLGEITLELAPAATRDVLSEELISVWRQELGQIPGVASMSFAAISAGGGNAIDIRIRGDRLEELEAAAEYLKEALADYDGVIDIASSNRLGKQEWLLERTTPLADSLGLSLEDISAQVRGAFYGVEVQRLQRGRDEVKVMVRYPESDRRSLKSLDELKIRAPGGIEVLLPELVEMRWRRGPDAIQRADRSRAISVTADVDKASGGNANEIRSSFERDVLSGLAAQFPGVSYTYEGEQKDQAQSVREIATGFLFALLVMYVLMAIPLKSYVQPIIIMSVIPFGLVGAVLGHILLGLHLSIMSMCGIVALAGVVVNDSLVLVDYMNRHRDESPSLREAAVAAGCLRFRPILLTSLTTFAGLFPMLSETDLQARFLIPMAVSLAFGILFATLITLVLVPAIYLVLEDIKGLFSRGKQA